MPWLISPLVVFAAFAAGIGMLMSHRLTALTAQPPGVEIAGTTAYYFLRILNHLPRYEG